MWGALERLAAGAAGVLQLAGEAGIGKSYLLGELLAEASRCGYRTALGRAREFGSEAPFGMFDEALDSLMANREVGEIVERLDDTTRTALGASVQALAGPAPASELPAYTMRRAMRLLLSALAAERPLVLALDDVHWADEESLLLLAYLLRHPSPGPVLLVLSHRLPGLPVNVAAALSESAESITLHPLSYEESRQLLPPELSDEQARRLWYDSGGNPLYLRELARTTGRESAPIAALPPAVPPEVPSIVAGSVAQELAELADASDEDGAGAVELARAAAVLGDGFDVKVAAEVAGLGEDRALRALDLLLERDLLRVEGPTSRFRFRHPIVLRAAYHYFGEGQRLASHARAAEVLHARGAPASMRAAHVARAASVGDRESAEVLAAAAQEVMLRSPALAARWLDAALRLLPSHRQDRPRRQEMLFQLAVMLAADGRLSDSAATFRDLLDDADLRPMLRAPVAIGAATAGHLLGAHDEAQAVLLSTLERLDESVSPAEAAMLRFTLASGSFFDGDWQSMRCWAREALAGGEGGPAYRATGLGCLALACYALGESDPAAEHAREAAGLIETLPALQLAGRLEGLALLGWTEYCLGHWTDARRLAERALAISRDTGQQHLEAPMLIIAAMARLAQAQPGEAAAAAEAARESAERAANHLFRTFALTVECMVEIVHGDLAQAVRLGEDALAAGRQSNSPWATVAGCYLAEAYLEAGDPLRARQQLLGAGAEPTLPPLPFYHVHVYATLTGTALALNDLDDADHWAQRALEAAERIGLDAPRAEAERAMATVLVARGDAASATERALAAARAASEAGVTVDAARALAIAAAAQARAGNPDRAGDYAQQARALAGSVGAPRLAANVAVLAPNGRPRRREGQRLTPRESEMVELATTHTNRDIASELGVSLKTVEATLARAFPKLGVTSRTQLASALKRRHR
jgi:DNA-binding NarL/FixJ family response regulator